MHSALSMLACALALASLTLHAAEAPRGETRAESLAVPATVLAIHTDRKDLTIGHVRVLVVCARRLGDESSGCRGFKVNGVPVEYRNVTGRGPANYELVLQPAEATGEFNLPELFIEYQPDDEAHACIAIGAKLNEIPNEFDSFYFTGNDRYAVLTYCSVEKLPAWGWDNARVTHNRTATLEEFRARIATTIQLPMTNRPLPLKLDGRTFQRSDLTAGELYQCGRVVPMPSGKIENARLSPGVYWSRDLPAGVDLHCP